MCSMGVITLGRTEIFWLVAVLLLTLFFVGRSRGEPSLHYYPLHEKTNKIKIAEETRKNK